MPKAVPMCAQCRKDKKSCVPKIRKWPTRCNRCIKHNYKCSPNAYAKGDHSDQTEGQTGHKKLRPTRELIEELDYINYLGNGLRKFLPVDPSLDTGWDILTFHAKFLVSYAIDAISMQIIEEAEAARDSLTMRDKSTDAEAIELMLCRLIDKEVIYEQPSRNWTGNDTSGNVLIIRKLCLELQAGRIFTVLKTLQEWCEFNRSTWVDFVRSPNLKADNKLLQIFTLALPVQERFVARCKSVDFTPKLPAGSVSILTQDLVDEFGDIENIIKWVDPLHLRALRCLPREQAYRYMHNNILQCPETTPNHTESECCELLDSTSERHWSKNTSVEWTPLQTSHAPEKLKPLIRDIFLKGSTEYLRTAGTGIGPENILEHGAEIRVLVDDTIRNISSVGNIWAPNRHPLLPRSSVMNILPQVQLNSLGLAVIEGSLRNVFHIISHNPYQALHRFSISDTPFITFAGPHNRIHFLGSTFSVFHLAMWNSQTLIFDKLFDPRLARNLTPLDIIDLYAIGIMHGNNTLLQRLEIASENEWKFSESQELTSAREEITSLAIDFAPWTALSIMLKGPWFQHLDFRKDIARRIIFRADYWQTRLLSQEITHDATIMYECYRQGYEAYYCAVNLLQDNAKDLFRYPLLQDRYSGLANCIAGACRLAGNYGSLRVDVVQAPHRLFTSFPSQYRTENYLVRSRG